MAFKLFIGNLSYDATEEQLKETFSEFGTVESCSIVLDRETNRSRGFAFVEMSTDEEGKAAIEGLDGKDFSGRALHVNEAKPKEPRSNNRGNGGGSFGGGNRY